MSLSRVCFSFVVLGVAAGCGVAGSQAAPLPTLSVNAAPIGRIAELRQVEGAPYELSPQMSWPAHTRAVLNLPHQSWKAQYPTDEPPAYVAVIPLDALKAHYPASAHHITAAINDVVSAARGGLIQRSPVSDGLPYLPLRNAHMAAFGSLARIGNHDIQGFRYLNIHSQEEGVRFPRTAVQYTFQGITRDGKNLVILHAPYEVPTLPTAEQIEREDSKYGGFLAPFPLRQGGPAEARWKQANERYLEALTTKLNAEGRVGRLTPLDAVVKSIRVGAAGGSQ